MWRQTRNVCRRCFLGQFLEELRFPTTAVGETLFGMSYTTTQGMMK